MRRPYWPRWPLLITLVAGVAVVIALAYLPSEEPGEAVPARGGEYIEGVAGSPSRINPLFAAFNEVDRDLSALIFSALVRLGANGAVETDLAESYQVTPDGLSYIFELRGGLFWHDGEPLTSADVVFTIEAIQDAELEKDPSFADLYRGVQVTAPDERTVVMTLAEPFAPFLARGGTVGILPEHLLGDLTAAQLFEAGFNRRPVGSGPFRLVQLTAAAAVLAPSETYHGGVPFLDRLELRFYRDDGELLNALMNDEVDGALFRPGVPPGLIAAIDADERWVRRSLHATTYDLVYLNPAVQPFEDARVRHALQAGLDREALIEDVLEGQALPVDSPIIRDLWASAALPDAYAFDAEQASALLDQAGWRLEAGGRSKGGETLAFELAVSDDPAQVRVAQELARQWAELGVQVAVRVSAGSQFVEGVLLPRRFEAALVSVDAGPDPDPYPLWHSSQALAEGRNLAGFSDAVADEVLEDGRLTTSPAQRADDYRLFQEIFARELPAVLLHTPTYQYIVRSELRGLSPSLLLTLSARFSDVHRWSIGHG